MMSSSRSISSSIPSTQSDSPKVAISLDAPTTSSAKEILEFEPQDFSLGAIIGYGPSGSVQEGTFKAQQYAFKSVNEEHWETVRDQFIADHPNILTPIGKCSQLKCLILPLGESLSEAIRHRFSDMDWHYRMRVALEIANGIHFIHSCNRAHNNLKSTNMLFIDGRIQLTDARERPEKPADSEHPNFLSPELFLSDELDDTNDYRKLDVYSFAMVLFHIVTGAEPFESMGRFEITHGYREERRPDIPHDIPRNMMQLLLRCWHSDLKRRPSIKDIKNQLVTMASSDDNLIIQTSPHSDDWSHARSVSSVNDYGSAHLQLSPTKVSFQLDNVDVSDAPDVDEEEEPVGERGVGRFQSESQRRHNMDINAAILHSDWERATALQNDASSPTQEGEDSKDTDDEGDAYSLPPPRFRSVSTVEDVERDKAILNTDWERAASLQAPPGHDIDTDEDMSDRPEGDGTEERQTSENLSYDNLDKLETNIYDEEKEATAQSASLPTEKNRRTSEQLPLPPPNTIPADSAPVTRKGRARSNSADATRKPRSLSAQARAMTVHSGFLTKFRSHISKISSKPNQKTSPIRKSAPSHTHSRMISFSLSKSLSEHPPAMAGTRGGSSPPTTPNNAHPLTRCNTFTSGIDGRGEHSHQESAELHNAIKQNNTLRVSSILCSTRNVINSPDQRGYTPLHLAAELGHTDIVDLLLSYQPNTEARDKLGLTPLHVAVMNGRRDTIDLLSHHQKERQSVFTPSGGDQIVDKRKVVFDENVILLQRNHWRDDFLEKVEFIFESSFEHNVKVGIQFPNLGDNVLFYGPGNQELKMKKNKNYSWTIQPYDHSTVMHAERKFPRSGRAKSMGFSYRVGYKWKHKWFWHSLFMSCVQSLRLFTSFFCYLLSCLKRMCRFWDTEIDTTFPVKMDNFYSANLICLFTSNHFSS